MNKTKAFFQIAAVGQIKLPEDGFSTRKLLRRLHKLAGLCLGSSLPISCCVF